MLKAILIINSLTLILAGYIAYQAFRMRHYWVEEINKGELYDLMHQVLEHISSVIEQNREAYQCSMQVISQIDKLTDLKINEAIEHLNEDKE
jgi:CMP-N-acetylneuraminic acid synthetase